MNNPFLAGTRVYLRALERADAPVILPWVNDPEVTRHLRLYRPMNLAAEEAFIDSLTHGDAHLAFGICDAGSDALVGVAGLRDIDARNRHAMFGIFIGEAGNRGRGLGTDATALVVKYGFDTLNLNRIWLQVFEDNPGAIHVYEKVGFVREGLLRQDSYSRGRYRNTVAMGILRAEWKRAKRSR